MSSTTINQANKTSIASMSLNALGDLLHDLHLVLESRTVDTTNLRSQLHVISDRLLQLSDSLTGRESATSDVSASTADQLSSSVPVPYRLLIAGSRDTTPSLLDWAAQAVKRAKAKNWAVLVGDAAGVDTAVISACNTLRVHYVCFGISEQPRSTAFKSLSEGGTGRYVRYGASYAERDRRMVEVADRGLFLWNGKSPGTKAAYDYMQSRGTPVDLLTMTAAATTTSATTQNRYGQTANGASKQVNARSTVETVLPATIELLLDVSTSGAMSKTLYGVYALRALDAGGNLLHQTRYELEEIPANAPDVARLHLLSLALDRLVRHLRRDRAPYALRLVQSSKNVEGWLAHGWKRNVPAVKEQGAAIDKLLQRFQRPEWIRMPPAQLTSALGKIQA